MNKEKVINDLIQKSINYLEAGEAFVKKELPVFVDELLKYNLIKESINLGYCIPLFLIAWLISYIFFIKKDEHGKIWVQRDENFDISPLAFILAVISFAVGVMCFVSNIFDVIKILVAPRLFLLEYLRSL